MLGVICFYYIVFSFVVCFFDLFNCLFFCISAGVVANFYWSRDAGLLPFLCLFLVHNLA